VKIALTAEAARHGDLLEPRPAREVYPLTDVGNRNRLVDRHGHRIRYCHGLGQFLVWDGTIWNPEAGEVTELAIETVAADAYLDGVQLPAPTIDCAAAAERHLYQVRLIRRELDEIEAQAAAMHERVAAWAKRRRERLERREAWHRGGLMAYMVWCGKKTLAMVNGTVRVVSGRDRIEVRDLEAFLAAAPDHCVRTVREPDKPALKRHLRATGELLPGTDLVRGEDSVTCTFDDRREGTQ
jgi:hypothetical protein